MLLCVMLSTLKGIDMSHEVFIVSAKRTPIGSFQGALQSKSAIELGQVAIKAVLEETKVAPEAIDEVYMGCVLTAGMGQAPARQAAKKAGLSDHTPATTVGKVCGSGLQSVVLGTKSILLGDAQVVMAGGMESMSNAPYLLPNARSGFRMGHAQVTDSMIHDGLWDPYKNWHMGNAGELCAKEWNFTREAQDAFAIESYRRANGAQSSGQFAPEIAKVGFEIKGETTWVEADEEPKKAKPEKVPTLKPAFDKAGTITAANASKINDGAAALLLCNGESAKKHGWNPMARVVAYASYAHAPEWFTTAPVHAIEAACKRAGLAPSDIDLYEINEAFAVVPMAAIKHLSLDPEKVNVRGGAIALGHPIGASGARVLTTLVHALKQEKKRYGLATLCIGGGEAVAVIVENIT